MPRSKRTVIDNAAEFGFANYGTDWYDRGVEKTYTAEPIAPEDDWTTMWLPAPVRLPDGSATDTITLWGRGLVTLGGPTEAQLAYMATLPDATDLHAFLESFPGGYIDAGFQANPYGAVEHGDGVHDFVVNPFGTFQDPQDPAPSGFPVFDYAQTRGYAYVTFAYDPYEGSSEDDDVENVPTGGPDGGSNLQFTDEGIQIGGQGGLLHFGGTDLAVGGDGFVYYSELNPVSLTDDADTASATAGPEQLIGLGGDDRLTGGAYADRLDGGDDNDVLVGGGGIDRLFGGDGDDTLSDGDEQGLLSGGAGNDVLRPGGGEDTIDGGDGIDRIVFDYSGWGGAIGFTLDPAKTNYLLPGNLFKSITNVEAVSFTAGGGGDTLIGRNGDDVLTGNGGQDGLFGNDGHDTLSGGDDHDYLEGGAGDDWLDGGSAFGPVVFNSGTYYEAYDLDAYPYLLVNGTEEEYYPGAAAWYSDFGFTANSMAQSLAFDLGSTNGNDASFFINVYDANGHEVYYGSFSSGSSTLNFNQFSYDDGSGEWVAPDPGRFTMTMSAYDDGAAQVSVGLRLSGVPIPDGDTMVGGIGDDTYVVDSLYDRVLEDANGGRDTIVTALASYSLAALPDIEKLAGDASAQVLSGNDADNTIAGRGGADRLDGAGGNDRLVVSATPVHVEGGSGTDRLVVDAGTPVVLDATLVSGVEKFLVLDGGVLDLSAFAASPGQLRTQSTVGGGATILGTTGADTLLGSRGADTLHGGGGDDLIVLTHQAQSIDGGEGRDTLSLAGGLGSVFAFSGDQLAGVEKVLLGMGSSLDLSGLAAAPGVVRIADGNGQVTGSDGADHIVGGGGDDVIAGGLGADVMTGGVGADRFVFLAAVDSSFQQGARDRIGDFHGGEGDRIDLSALADNFAFIGANAFSGSGSAAEVRVETKASGALVQVDLDHDGHADMAFVVRADAPLTADDFSF